MGDVVLGELIQETPAALRAAAKSPVSAERSSTFTSSSRRKNAAPMRSRICNNCATPAVASIIRSRRRRSGKQFQTAEAAGRDSRAALRRRMAAGENEDPRHPRGDARAAREDCLATLQARAPANCAAPSRTCVASCLCLTLTLRRSPPCIARTIATPSAPPTSASTVTLAGWVHSRRDHRRRHLHRSARSRRADADRFPPGRKCRSRRSSAHSLAARRCDSGHRQRRAARARHGESEAADRRDRSRARQSCAS